MLSGKKTHILVLLAALITAYQAATSGTMDLESAKQVIELFIISGLREGMKLIGTGTGA